MKFKKLSVSALVTLAACLAITACGKTNEENPDRNTNVSSQQSVVTEPSSIQEPTTVTEPSDVPDAQAVSTEFSASGTVGDYTYEMEPDFTVGKRYYNLTQRGFIWDSLEEDCAPEWITVTSGEKSTGGYAINIVDIKEDGDGVIIIVEETSPAPDQTVTEAFEYPCTTVRFDYGPNGAPKNYKVVTTEGEELKPVN